MSAVAFPPSAKVRWLVEIHVKDWIPTVKSEDRILGYVEVDVSPDCDEFEARRTGFDVFATKLQYEPTLKRRVVAIVGSVDNPRELTNKFCAPDAVRL